MILNEVTDIRTENTLQLVVKIVDCHRNQHRDPQYIQSHGACVNIQFWHFQEGLVHIRSEERQLTDGDFCEREENGNALITTELRKYRTARIKANYQFCSWNVYITGTV